MIEYATHQIFNIMINKWNIKYITNVNKEQILGTISIIIYIILFIIILRTIQHIISKRLYSKKYKIILNLIYIPVLLFLCIDIILLHIAVDRMRTSNPVIFKYKDVDICMSRKMGYAPFSCESYINCYLRNNNNTCNCINYSNKNEKDDAEICGIILGGKSNDKYDSIKTFGPNGEYYYVKRKGEKRYKKVSKYDIINIYGSYTDREINEDLKILKIK
jgi:hypothetical protein